MFNCLLVTSSDPALTILRIVLGVVMFAHGAQKVLGWYGGRGFAAAMGFFKNLGIPAVFGYLAIIAEFFGSIALIVGLLTRLGALGLTVNMIVAVGTVAGTNGFFMNWFGKLKAGAEGYEFHLLAIAMGIALVLNGGGPLSIDGLLSSTSTCQVPW